MFTVTESGNYKAGLHKTNLKEIEKNLVLEYPTSITRRRNYESLNKIIRTDFFISIQSIIHSIWIDGSFCTTKENPNDIDGIILFEVKTDSDLNQYLQVRNLFHNDKEDNLHNQLRRNYNDLYVTMEIESAKRLLDIGILNSNDVIIDIANKEIEAYHYWLNFFGNDRLNNPKALYSIDLREELSHNE